MSLQLPASGSYRVIRGGSWYFVPQFARVAYRGGNAPDYRNYILGVRFFKRCL